MDMSAAIVPKSDQINADDLLSGPITIKISSVKVSPGTEQPVSIFFDGSDKAYRCCKSMARVLVTTWGADSSKYVGRSLTLYCDPKVKWGGMEVGGIRISHMSDISSPLTMALTATRGSRKPFTVRPIEDDGFAAHIAALIVDGKETAEKGSGAYEAWWKSLRKDERTAIGTVEHERMKAIAAVSKSETV